MIVCHGERCGSVFHPQLLTIDYSLRTISFHAVAGLLIVGIGAAIYANSLKVPFVFDDSQNVAHNEHLRLTNLSPDGLYAAAFNSPLPSRPVANLSFALNYYWGGKDPLTSIHVVNILVHVTNGLLVYGLALTWLSMSDMISQHDSGWGTPQARRRAVALTSALLFVVHPVQTQSVTYVVQRMASLSVMFYLIALVLYFAGRVQRDVPKRYFLWVASLIAWALALGSKQIAVTLPLIVVLAEWLLISRSNQVPRVDYRRWSWWVVRLVVVLAASFVLLCIVAGWNPVAELTRHFAKREFTTIERLWTQARIVVFYLSLLFFPHPVRLNLLHDIFPPVSDLSSAGSAASILILATMLGWGFYFTRRQPIFAFGIFWFFIQLLLESTVIPLEMVFEHRLYLPSIGVILFILAFLDSIAGRWRPGVYAMSAIVVLLMAGGTVVRNRVWQNEIGLWTDAIVKSPCEPRSWNNRGKAYVALGELDKAQRDYEVAIKLSNRLVEAVNNLGNLFVDLEQQQLAIDYLTRAIKRRPRLPVFRYNRGVAYEHFEEYALAIADYDAAIERKKDFLTAYFNRGVVYGKMKQQQRAIEDFGRVLAKNPKRAAAYMNRGDAYMQLGHVSQALNDFEDVIRLEPDMAQAYYNRAGAYFKLGNKELALCDYDRAIELAQLDLAYYNRANIYMGEGQHDRAIEDYTVAIELDPRHTAAYNNRGLCYMNGGDYLRAIADFDRAIEVDPSSPIPYVSRGNAHALANNHPDAIRNYNHALERNPNLVQGYFNRGVSRAALSNHLGAVRDFDRAIQLVPNDPANYHQRALSLFTLQRYTESRQDALKCQQLGRTPNADLMKQLDLVEPLPQVD